MSAETEFADPKAIGHDVESLVVDALDALEAADDLDDHHDAVASALLDPALVETTVPVVWAGVPTVATGTRLEIKAAKRSTSNGTGSVPGRWHFKGRDDGQHAALLEDGALYLLALYDQPGAGDSRRLLALVVVPATLLDEHLSGRWYDVDREEGTVAQLHWNHIIDGTEVFDE